MKQTYYYILAISKTTGDFVALTKNWNFENLGIGAIQFFESQKKCLDSLNSYISLMEEAEVSGKYCDFTVKKVEIQLI